jgi:hypothetical protein
MAPERIDARAERIASAASSNDLGAQRLRRRAPFAAPPRFAPEVRPIRARGTPVARGDAPEGAMVIRAHIVVATFGAVVAAGCAASSPPPPSSPSSEPSSSSTIAPTPGARATCPLGVTGAEVAVSDEASGAVAIAFTTKGDVAELRRRVRDQAANYGPGAHQGLGHGGAHAGAQTHGLRLSELPAIDAQVSDIDGGARLLVATKDAAERDHVRSELHERAAKIVALGDCP